MISNKAENILQDITFQKSTWTKVEVNQQVYVFHMLTGILRQFKSLHLVSINIRNPYVK